MSECMDHKKNILDVSKRLAEINVTHLLFSLHKSAVFSNQKVLEKILIIVKRTFWQKYGSSIDIGIFTLK